jgi:hypothetical protein
MTTSKALNPILRETWRVEVKTAADLEMVLSRINNPERQLTIHVDRLCSEGDELVQDLKEVPSYKVIVQEESNEIDWVSFSKRHAVIKIRLTSPMYFFDRVLSDRLQELHLENDDLALLSEIDANGFSQLQKFSLNGCCVIRNLSSLQNLQSLTLRNCNDINDVSAFARIPDLTLITCNEITDISPLTGNERLRILDCENIRPSTMSFTNVKFLHTDLIREYEQSAALKNCVSLTLEGFADSRLATFRKALRNVTIVAGYYREDDEYYPQPLQLNSFGHLFSVTLDSHPQSFLNLRPLHSVSVVELRFLQITSIQGLGGNRKVFLVQCNSIEDFSPLRNVPRVEICGCDGLQSGEGLENVSDLTIDYCEYFSDTRALTKAESLTFINCFSLNHLMGLEIVPIVSILECNEISSLDGLGKNEKILMSFNKSKRYSDSQSDFTDTEIDELYLTMLKESPTFVLDHYILTCRTNQNHREIALLMKSEL